MVQFDHPHPMSPVTPTQLPTAPLPMWPVRPPVHSAPPWLPSPSLPQNFSAHMPPK